MGKHGLYCLLVILQLLIHGCLVTGLRDVKVTAPMAPREGDSVVLHCHYDLEGDPLYAIKWYKGRAEFYRYTPTDKPPIKLFAIPGLSELHVDKARSNETQLFLKGVTPSLSGQYSCEVSADAPSFHTAIAAAFMNVVDVPLQPPFLSGIKPKYRVRDTMRANCTAAPSRPAVNLTWSINGEDVNMYPRLVKQYRQVPEKYKDLQQSMSELVLPLRAQHFTAGGRMKVRCTASLYDLYWQTTEKSVEQEGREGMVRDNQVPGSGGRDKYDGDHKDSAFPSSSEKSLPSSQSRTSPGLCSLAVYGGSLLLATAYL